MAMPLHGSVGAILAAARKAASLELTDVARETRVPLRHLRALEADSHDGLPALPYTTGFVKAFARTVGLDAEAISAQFRAETSKTAHVPAQAPLAPLDERRLPPRGLVIASVAALVLLVGGLWAFSAGLFETVPPPPAVAAAPVVVPSDADVSPTAAQLDGGVAVAAPLPVATPAGPAQTGAVAFTPTEDVWVKLTDRVSGDAVKVGILKRGERYVVPGDPARLVLRTGKAGTLGITVGGRAIAPLGGQVETVSNISLDPVALTTGRGPPPIAATVAGDAPAVAE